MVFNLILYPSKHGDKHQNYFDTMYNYRDIDENKTFSNGGRCYFNYVFSFSLVFGVSLFLAMSF